MNQEEGADRDLPAKERALYRLASSRVVGGSLWVLAGAVALALLAVLSAVGTDPVGGFVAAVTTGGYRVSIEWPRLVLFTVLVGADVVLLALAGTVVLRESTASEGTTPCAKSWLAQVVVHGALLFPAGALSFVLLGFASTGNPSVFTFVEHELVIAAGTVVVVALATLIVVWAAPRRRWEALRRGPWSVNAIAAIVVLAGTAAPYAVTAVGSPLGESVVLTGFAEVLAAPAPRLVGAYDVACGDRNRCVVVTSVHGLPASDAQYEGVAATADAGRTWRSALLASGVELSSTGLTCRANRCWGWAHNLDPHRGAAEYAIVSVVIASSGAPTVVSHAVTRQFTGLAYWNGNCWSAEDCLVVVSTGSLPPATASASAPAVRRSRGTEPPGETALSTSDGGALWRAVPVPFPPGSVVRGRVGTTALTSVRGPWCTAYGSCLVTVSAKAQECRSVTTGTYCTSLQVVDATTDGGQTWSSRASIPQSDHLAPILCSSPPACEATDVMSARPTSVLSIDTGASWGEPVHMAGAVERLSCSVTACVRVERRTSTTVMASVSTDGARSWGRGAVLPSDVSFGATGTSTCSVAGPCVAASWRPGPPQSSTVVAVSAPGGTWRVRTLPPPRP